MPLNGPSCIGGFERVLYGDGLALAGGGQTPRKYLPGMLIVVSSKEDVQRSLELQHAEIDRHPLPSKQMNDDVIFGGLGCLRSRDERHQQVLGQINRLRRLSRVRTGDHGNSVLRMRPSDQRPRVSHHRCSGADIRCDRLLGRISQGVVYSRCGGIEDCLGVVQVFQLPRDELDVAGDTVGSQFCLQPVREKDMSGFGIAQSIHELLCFVARKLKTSL